MDVPYHLNDTKAFKDILPFLFFFFFCPNKNLAWLIKLTENKCRQGFNMLLKVLLTLTKKKYLYLSINKHSEERKSSKKISY